MAQVEAASPCSVRQPGDTTIGTTLAAAATTSEDLALLMTRIAAGHPGIWPDICAENRTAIVTELDRLVATLLARAPSDEESPTR